MTAVQIPDSTIVGQFPASAGGGHFGLVLAKGSPLTSCVDKAIAALKANGTLAQIQTTWLSDKANAPILQVVLAARPRAAVAPAQGGASGPARNVSIAVISTIVVFARDRARRS